MSIIELLNKYYGDNDWCCGDTYDSLYWNDMTIPKPSKEHLESLWNDLLKDEMREARNKLLKDSDYTVLSDYPHSSDEKKNEWLKYREALRNFPAIWTPGTPFPSPPQ